MKKNNKGFSLVELIVVVLILGILAVAVTPQIMNWINKSKIAKDQNYAGTVATAVESIALEYIGTGRVADIDDKLTVDSTGVKDKNGKATSDSACTQFAKDVEAMIGAGKCQSPEQSGMTKYHVTTNVTDPLCDVQVEPTA